MTETEKQLIHQFVDQSLYTLRKLDLMQLPIDDMPAEMIDDTQEAEDDWIPWKAIPSTVTDLDLQEIEALNGIPFPESFRAFLRYKHFYELYTPKPEEVRFFQHPIHDWKQKYIHSPSTYKERLLNKGYIPFADHYDWGIVCFDTNIVREHNEYPIVMIDHESLYNEPMPVQEFNDSFIEMIKYRLLEK